MIHRSPLPDLEIPAQLLTPYVLRQATRLTDKPALVHGPTGDALTYGQLERGIRAVAGGLLGLGLQPGQVVAVMAPNMPQYALAFHGVAMAGGIVTTINPTYTEREVHHQLVDAGSIMLLTVSPFLEMARGAVKGTGVTSIYLLDDRDGEGARPFRELFGSPVTEQVPVSVDDVVVLPYSSGTTGISKGVRLTHRNLVANLVQALATVGMAEHERAIAVLPFFHIYGMQILMNLCLSAGATVITMPRFDLEGFLKTLSEHRINRAFVAPPIVVALAKHPLVDQYDLSALTQIFSGAAPLSAELALACGKRLGCEVVQGYGMTELSPVSHATPAGQFKPGSVGITVPNTETLIVDPATGRPVGIDVDGEVWVRGPQVMAGYLNNPEATAATIDADGWLHTGDIGHLDADGHLHVVDRLKELIKYKGFQVPPAELEALLLKHPAVADSAVIGIPDDEAGEIPAGYVVLKQGAAATAEEIMGFVAGQVATYKHIRRITFVDVIPKSASGKILRRELRAAAAIAAAPGPDQV